MGVSWTVDDQRNVSRAVEIYMIGLSDGSLITFDGRILMIKKSSSNTSWVNLYEIDSNSISIQLVKCRLGTWQVPNLQTTLTSGTLFHRTKYPRNVNVAAALKERYLATA